MTTLEIVDVAIVEPAVLVWKETKNVTSVTVLLFVHEDLVSLVVSEVFVGSDVCLVGSLVGVDSYVGSPALFKVIAGMLEENPGGGPVPGGGGGRIPGPILC